MLKFSKLALQDYFLKKPFAFAILCSFMINTIFILAIILYEDRNFFVKYLNVLIKWTVIPGNYKRIILIVTGFNVLIFLLWCTITVLLIVSISLEIRKRKR